MALHEKNNEFSKEDGAVRYIDGSILSRPLDLPLPFRGALVVFVIAAAIIGGIFLYNVADRVLNEPIREADATQKYLDKEINLMLPVLKDFIQHDDVYILNYFTEQGLTIYNLSSSNAENGVGFDIIKLPDDVSLVDAGILYSQGVSNLSSSDAARLLNGSWRMTVGRGDYVEMKVKYADFTSGTVEAAVLNAVAWQGLSDSILGDSGVDSAGNTYQSGQVEVYGTWYNWQISACPLSEVYSVDGLPDDAVYVGVRVYL